MLIKAIEMCIHLWNPIPSCGWGKGNHLWTPITCYVYTNLWTSISVHGWAMCIHLWTPFPGCDWDMFCESISELLFLAVVGVYVSIHELLFLAMAGVCYVYPFMNSYSWLWLRYVMWIHLWTHIPGYGWGMCIHFSTLFLGCGWGMCIHFWTSFPGCGWGMCIHFWTPFPGCGWGM